MAYLGKTPSQAVRSRFYFTASGGETSLAPAQVTGLSFTDANYVDVSLNGVALVSGTDYTATPSTNTISSLAALTASDVVEIVVYDVFSVFGGSVNGDFTISNGTLAAEAVTVTGLTTTGNINFGDNDKANFGAGNDLQIYHNGAASIIQDVGSGDLFLAGDNNVTITNSDFSENKAKFISNGGAVLYYNNNPTVTVTSTGVDVTGTVTADNVTMTSDDPTITMTDSSGTNDIATIQATSGALIVTARDGSADGEIIFKKTDGSATDETLRITSAGNVGIGTASPTSFGGTTLQTNHGSTYSANLVSSGAYVLQMIASATHGAMSMGARSNHHVAFTTNDTERMRIDTSGNVGISTSSPVSQMTLGGTSDLVFTQNGYGIAWGGNNGSPRIFGTSGGSLSFKHGGGSTAMTIDSSGNVGINQTSPLYPLHVSEASGDTAAIYIDGPTNGYSVLYLGDSDDIDRSMVSYNHTNDDLTFRAAARSSLRLNGSGTLIYENVAATAANLEINGASTNGHYNIIMNGNVNNGYKIAFKHGSSLVGSIITAGSNTSYNTSSDHRLKENVADMTGAIDRVKALAPKRFSFITDADTTVDGFLAHEAQAVVPEAVTGTHNEVDDDGNAVMQGIDQSKLVPLLTGALREAITKIETLETQRADIEARLTALENAE
jgi:hypothetical protein